MPAYHVVLVRFDGGHQSYPVNGHQFWKPGERVVVEMAGDPPTLARAEVVGTSFAKKPCRHGIRGSVENPRSFLPGPHGVHRRDELIRFLKQRSFTAVAVEFQDGSGQTSPSPEWDTAYVPGYDPDRYGPNDYYQAGAVIVLVGDESAGIHFPANHGSLFIAQKDRTLIFSPYNRVETFPHRDGTPFHRVAMNFGGDLSYVVEKEQPGEYIGADYDGD